MPIEALSVLCVQLLAIAKFLLHVSVNCTCDGRCEFLSIVEILSDYIYRSTSTKCQLHERNKFA